MKLQTGADLYLSSSKARLWMVFTLFSWFLLAVQRLQFKKLKGKLAWSLESFIWEYSAFAMSLSGESIRLYIYRVPRKNRRPL